MSNNQPSRKFRIGAVTATVWENANGDRAFYNTTVSRSYKDGEDWKETDSLGHGDLLNASRALNRAEAWISDQAE